MTIAEKHTTTFVKITDGNSLMIPYASQIKVLMTTIIKDITEISFTDLDFQVLKICGTKVMQESVPAINPKISGLKFILNFNLQI